MDHSPINQNFELNKSSCDEIFVKIKILEKW
jgi:hypothetical protein